MNLAQTTLSFPTDNFPPIDFTSLLQERQEAFAREVDQVAKALAQRIFQQVYDDYKHIPRKHGYKFGSADRPQQLVFPSFCTQKMKEIPDHHKKAVIACHIGARSVYKKGMNWFPSIVDILPILLESVS